MLAELSVLRDAGYLQSEPGVTSTRLRDEVDKLVAHHPRNIMFLVTEACNLRCTYCYEVGNSFHDTARMMSFANAKEILDAFFERNGGREDLCVTFFGGEPLLNHRLVRQVVEYSHERGAALGKKVTYTITTNATLMTEEIADFLVKYQVGVMVSLDGEKEANDRYRVDREGHGTHDRAVAGIKLLLDKQNRAGVRPLRIRATMTAENIDRRAIVDYFRSLGNVRLTVGMASGTAFGKKSFDVTSRDRPAIDAGNDSYTDELLRAAEQGGKPPRDNPVFDSVVDLHKFMQEKVPGRVAAPKLCGVGRNMLAVTPTGQYFPCHRYVGMDAWRLGSQFDGGLDEGAVRTYYGKLFANFYGHCTKCWLRFRCGGQCPWYLSTPTGEITHPDAESCDSIRAFEERVTWVYLRIKEQHAEWFAAHVTSAAPSHDDCALPGSAQASAATTSVVSN
jgi:uncharacterized protein